MALRRTKNLTPTQIEEIRTKDFFDMILPGAVKFFPDHYILGDSYRSVWVIREYPPSTEEQAILSRLADRSGVDSPSRLSSVAVHVSPGIGRLGHHGSQKNRNSCNDRITDPVFVRHCHKPFPDVADGWKEVSVSHWFTISRQRK